MNRLIFFLTYHDGIIGDRSTKSSIIYIYMDNSTTGAIYRYTLSSRSIVNARSSDSIGQYVTLSNLEGTIYFRGKNDYTDNDVPVYFTHDNIL